MSAQPELPRTRVTAESLCRCQTVFLLLLFPLSFVRAAVKALLGLFLSVLPLYYLNTVLFFFFFFLVLESARMPLCVRASENVDARCPGHRDSIPRGLRGAKKSRGVFRVCPPPGGNVRFRHTRCVQFSPNPRARGGDVEHLHATLL